MPNLEPKRIIRKFTDETDTPADTEVLIFDAALDKWKAGPGGGGATNLDSLTDVTIAGVATGDLLKKGAGDWINFARGTTLQYLRVNEAGTDLEYAAGGFIMKSKAADETVNNSSVLQNDNDLFFAVSANDNWLIELMIRLDLKLTSDFKYTFTIPAGGLISGVPASINSPTFQTAQAFVAEIDLTTTRTYLQAASLISIWSPVALYIGGANGGTVQFQWAQNTAAVEDTIVKEGSSLRATKLN